MEPVQYLRALRQWWWVIVTTTVLGVLLAMFAMPSSATAYQATETLLSPSSGQIEGIPSLAQMAVLVRAGDVPRRAATDLGISPSEAVAGLDAFPDDVAGSITIVVEDSDKGEAVARAEALAKALIESVDDTAGTSYDTKVAAAQARVDALTTRLAGLSELDPTFESAQSALSDAQSTLDTQRGTGPPTTDLQILSAPTTAAVSSTSKVQRVLIAGGVGLVIGLGLALVLSRFDTRIHGREEAEDAFRYPVIGEIPQAPRSLRGAEGAAVVNRPDSPLAEAYRSLRSSLVFLSRTVGRPPAVGEPRADGSDEGDDESSKRARIIMVMSAGMSEGKSTCVANLALTFAETGNRVLVASCDLRRPAIEKYLRVENDIGVSDVLAGDAHLEDAIVPTTTEGVSVVTSGTPISKPAELFAHASRLIDPARDLFDVVIVDTPPVLATDDTSQIIPLVDNIVLVARVGATTEEAARRVGERLTRLGAPIAGVVLIGVHALPSVRGYYRSYVPHTSRFRRSQPSSVPHDDPPVSAAPTTVLEPTDSGDDRADEEREVEAGSEKLEPTDSSDDRAEDANPAESPTSE